MLGNYVLSLIYIHSPVFYFMSSLSVFLPLFSPLFFHLSAFFSESRLTDLILSIILVINRVGQEPNEIQWLGSFLSSEGN